MHEYITTLPRMYTATSHVVTAQLKWTEPRLALNLKLGQEKLMRDFSVVKCP